MSHFEILQVILEMMDCIFLNDSLISRYVNVDI